MISEVALETAETLKEYAEDIMKDTLKKSVDVSKRIDLSSSTLHSESKRIDISKRIENDSLVKGERKLGKELSQKQKDELSSNGMSPGVLKDCTYQDGIYKIKTINEKYEGQHHLETNILYEKKIIEVMNNKIEGVFPLFESCFTTYLPKEIWQASDAVQFKECMLQLQKGVQENPELRKKFSKRQLEQISDGKTPSGYTWHHNEEVGKMELVDSQLHLLSKHTGGKAIWGGGR